MIHYGTIYQYLLDKTEIKYLKKGCQNYNEPSEKLRIVTDKHKRAVSFSKVELIWLFLLLMKGVRFQIKKTFSPQSKDMP